MTNDETQLAAPTGSPLPMPHPTRGDGAARAEPHPVDRLREGALRLLQHDGAAIAMLGLDGAIHHLNQSMLDLVGADSAADVTADSTADGILRSFLDHIPTELFRSGDHVWQGHVDHRGPDGRRMVLRATASGLDDPSAPGGGDLALLLHDITDRDEQMRELVHHATHDPLTGLANRHQVLDQLAKAIAAQRGRGGHVAAIFFDLDRLKYVNEAFGHAAGDQLLVSSARRLEQAIRPVDAIARIGGDEFLAIAADVDDSVAAIELADRARRALAGHLRFGDFDMDFYVSVGVALTDADLMELADEDAASMLISNAESAMNQSKQDGRSRCTLFTPQMRSTARENTEMASALSHAITSGELAVEYQPIHSAMSGEVLAAEALVRWTHPSRGQVDALTIIEVAERSGSIGRLGEFVLEHALADLAHWRSSGAVDATFAVHVNVSRLQLRTPSFVNLVIDRLRHHRLEASQLVLEARESPLLSHESEVTRSIRALRRFGVRIAIDNFGTGSKALAVLTDIGADVLKLDGSLALPSGSSETDLRLVRAVVSLAHTMDIEVVAERVSGQEQLHHLRAAGCDRVQGHLLGHPAPAETIDFTISPLA